MANPVGESAAIFRLPAEVCYHILSMLPNADFSRIAKTCRVWHQLCADIFPTRHAQLCLASIDTALTEHKKYELPATTSYLSVCSALALDDPEVQKTKTLVIERWKAYTHFFLSETHKANGIIQEAVRRSIIDDRPDHIQALLGSAIRKCLKPNAAALNFIVAAQKDRRACLSHLLRNHTLRMQEESPLPLYDGEEPFNPIEAALHAALFAGHTECARLLLESVKDPAQTIREIQAGSHGTRRYPQESITFMESILNPKA